MEEETKVFNGKGTVLKKILSVLIKKTSEAVAKNFNDKTVHTEELFFPSNYIFSILGNFLWSSE